MVLEISKRDLGASPPIGDPIELGLHCNHYTYKIAEIGWMKIKRLDFVVWEIKAGNAPSESGCKKDGFWVRIPLVDGKCSDEEEPSYNCCRDSNRSAKKEFP